MGKNLDGGLFAAFGLFAMVGLSAGHHIDLDPYLNARGQETTRGVENACVLDLFDYSGLKSSTLTTDGRALTDLLDEEPFASVLAENRIGQRRPAAPVLLTHSVLDDTIPFSVGKQLARDWCAQGANLRWSPNAAPLHLGGRIPSTGEALPWLGAPFARVRIDPGRRCGACPDRPRRCPGRGGGRP